MLTAERDTTRRDGAKNALPVAAGAKLYAGALVAKNASGYAVPASDTAGLTVYGRAGETVDNSAGAAGDKSIVVLEGCFAYAGSGFTAADVGKPAFVTDDETVNTSGGNHKVFAGNIKEVSSSTEVFIQVSPDLRAAGVVAAVASSDAPSQGASYAQADVQAIATVANETKAQLNALISALKAAGLMGS